MNDQTEFTKQFFETHPDTEFDLYDAEEALRHGWLEMTGEKFRDPARKLRELREDDYLTSRRADGVLYVKLNRR